MMLAAGRKQAGLADKQIEYCVEVTARGALLRHAHKNALCFSYPRTGCAGWGRAVGGHGGKASGKAFLRKLARMTSSSQATKA
jgi:hypothetical protein